MQSGMTYLDARTWFEHFADTEKHLPITPAEFNLPRTARFVDMLGNPQHHYPSVVVAGTNGKGSTCAMIESILRAAGLRVGLYTSPHLHLFRERMQINRCMISQQQFAAIAAMVDPATKHMAPSLGPLSQYEVATAMGLVWFAEQRVDCAILEIGLGGRDDAVNIVTPNISVISAIGLDHTHILGHTHRAIAMAKAGIIKPRVPIVTVPQHPEAFAVIAEVAATHQSRLYVCYPDGIREYSHGSTPNKVIPYPIDLTPDRVGLSGAFQLQNARLAVATAWLLRDSGLSVQEEAIVKGLATVQWPARIEQVHVHPCVLLDGAHNPDAATCLMDTIATMGNFHRRILILGVSSDKQLDRMAHILVPSADHVIVTRSCHVRAMPLDRLTKGVIPYVQGSLSQAYTVTGAVDIAQSFAGNEDVIIITGSLFVAAEARRCFL